MCKCVFGKIDLVELIPLQIRPQMIRFYLLMDTQLMTPSREPTVLDIDFSLGNSPSSHAVLLLLGYTTSSVLCVDLACSWSELAVVTVSQ